MAGVTVARGADTAAPCPAIEWARGAAPAGPCFGGGTAESSSQGRGGLDLEPAVCSLGGRVDVQQAQGLTVSFMASDSVPSGWASRSQLRL